MKNNEIGDVAAKRCAIRLYSADGQRSTRIDCDESSSSSEICSRFSCDTLTLQIGAYHFRALKPATCPVQVLRDFCHVLTRGENRVLDEILEYAGSASFRHVIALFLGKPRVRGKSSAVFGGVLSEDILLRTGKIIHSWQNARVVFHNSTIRLQIRNDQDEILDLRNMRCDTYNSKRGKALRLRDADSNSYLLIFQRPHILQLWLTRAHQAEKRTHVDASDEQLVMIPEQILNNDSRVEVLNLRRNSLQSRPAAEKPGLSGPIGYIDDLYRVRSLQVVDLSANQILEFPVQLTTLPNLRQLNISSNFLTRLPSEIGNLRKLQSLSLANNLLADLGDEILNCTNLCQLDLSFNQFSHVPACLQRMRLATWQLAGNNIENTNGMRPTNCVERIDLRRNILLTSFRILDLENITHLDIRDNSLISTVNLTNLRFLQVLHCERLQLTSLHLSGESLTHIYADNNLLDSIVVMPVPQNLHTISLSFNHFVSLPEWFCDCPNLSFLRVNNNRLRLLPERILRTPSLRCLFAFENQLDRLPDVLEINNLEILLLYRNNLTHLPRNFFATCARLRQLNISSNRVETLPMCQTSKIQVLRAANNNLSESCVPVIMQMKHVKVLDLSHNLLNAFDDSALSSLEMLEEINVSSNRLTRLSDRFSLLPSLQILRAHSNRIVHIPSYFGSSQINTIDISSNNISLGTLEFTPPPSLRHFDVSCNSGDLATRILPKMHTIDVAENQQRLPHFQIGVSGSRGSKNKQCIRQIRVNNTFAFVDGGSNYYISLSICRFISQYLADHSDADIRTVLLRCHCELGEEGERLGASVLIVRIAEQFLEIASIGTNSAVLVKNERLQYLINGRYEIDDEEYSRIRESHGFVDEDNRINGVIRSAHQLGHFSTFPLTLPTYTHQILPLDDTIDGLIVANSVVWSMVRLDEVANTFHTNRSPIVVAKQLQDKVQSYDYGGNTNVLVLKRSRPQVVFASNTAHSDVIATAIPAMVIESHPVPAARAHVISPPPPPLPRSAPPDELESVKRDFHEMREILSKSLKIGPPNVTFSI